MKNKRIGFLLVFVFFLFSGCQGDYLQNSVRLEVVSSNDLPFPYEENAEYYHLILLDDKGQEYCNLDYFEEPQIAYLKNEIQFYVELQNDEMDYNNPMFFYKPKTKQLTQDFFNVKAFDPESSRIAYHVFNAFEDGAWQTKDILVIQDIFDQDIFYQEVPQKISAIDEQYKVQFLDENTVEIQYTNEKSFEIEIKQIKLNANKVLS